MGSARKFLALALASCLDKQYEEAGVFLAQAAKEEDAAKLAEELGVFEGNTSVSSNIEDETTVTDGQEAGACDESNKAVAEGESAVENKPEEEEDWGDDEHSDEEESVSSVARRRTTTLFQIGKVLAASMSLSAEEEDEEESESGEDGEEALDAEADPDFPGETLIPASFSSVRVKSNVVKSPVRLKE